MKKALILVLLLSLSFVWSQVEWQEDGIPVRQGVNIEWFRSAIELPGGGCVYTWSDTRRADRDVFAQRVDTDGNLMWGEEAVLINGVIDRQEDIVVINGANDETIYAWVDFRHEIAGDIYAQKLDGDGNIMWAEAGVPLCLAEEIQISLNIVSDDDGGAYIIWLDDRNPGGFDIYGTHILSDGSIAAGWETNGSPIVAADGGQTQHTFWADGEGGAICVWHDERDANNQNLYMQRIAADGTHLWEENGSVLCDAPQIQESGKMSPDGEGGFIIAWRDRRLDPSGDIYANRIDLDGNILWAEDVVVNAGVGNQRNPRVTMSSDGGAFVAWEDDHLDGYYWDIYMQKVNLDGSLAWNSDGVTVSTDALHQLNPRNEGDDDGGCWVIWDDGRNGNYPNIDIYVQHFDAAGNALLEASGRIVCGAFGEQFSPLIKRDETGQVYLIWGDNRTGSTGIYHQLVDDSGNMLLEDDGAMVYYGLCGDGTNYRMLAKADSRMLLWKDTRKAVIASQIYMQVLYDDGSFGLIENGVPITEMTEANQENMQCELMGEDAVVVWEELRGDMLKTYIQKIGNDAQYQWGEMGLQLSEFDTNHQNAQLSVMGNEVYVGWNDVNEDFENPVFQICAQKVVDGVIQWDAEGVVVGENTGDDVLTDIVEDYFIWELQASPDFNIYMNRLTSDGAVAEGWAENGNLICGAIANQQNAKGIMTPDGLLVVWEDLRNGADKDIYAQMVGPDGSTLWADDGIALVSEMQDQSGFEMALYDGFFYLIWEDMRNGGDYDIYMQKYDLDGNQQWTSGGIGIAVKPNQQANPTFTFNDESILIYWDDVVNDNDINLFSQRLDYEGNLTGWDEDGLMICGAIKSQQNPLAVTDGYRYSYVIWSDFRSSGKTDIFNIYSQKLDHSLNAYNDQAIEEMININLNNYPNPFRNGTILSFDLHRSQLTDGRVNIYNVRGQKVRSLDTDDNTVYWDGRDSQGKLAASGIYMYQFVSDRLSSQAAKMIRMK